MASFLVATISNLHGNALKSSREFVRMGMFTDGIKGAPLNRRRTLLSIPLGFRHAACKIISID